jgi:hypothetical protein
MKVASSVETSGINKPAAEHSNPEDPNTEYQLEKHLV